MINTDFDIIIVGGGMVGLAMAASLSSCQLHIAIIEKNNFKALESTLKNTRHLEANLTETDIESFNYDTRVSAISPANQSFLEALNCWQHIPISRLAFYEKMKVWDGEALGSIEFDAAELAQRHLGCIVENQLLRAAIYKQLKQNNKISFLTDMNLDSIQSSDVSNQLTFSNHSGEQQKITTQLIIGADGAFSSVREKMAIPLIQKSYQQTAFVVNVKTELPHKNTAWQRFTKHGPVAFLPLPKKNVCSVVWTVDTTQAEEIVNLSPQNFCDRLAKTFELRLGQLSPLSKIQQFPLVKRHAETYLATRCVLIGDAAHTVHPLAGQGVNLGFQDVACLSAIIKQQLDKKRDFGLIANLRRYERQRKSENYIMQDAMSGFKWLFGQESTPLILARSWGLSSLDKMATIKRLIISKAIN